MSKQSLPLRHKLQALTWAERWLLMEAAWWLTVMAGAIRVVPFKRIAGWLGLVQVSIDSQRADKADKTALAVGWAVRAVAARTPWTSTCLAQALAGVQMLRQRRIASSLTLGVALAPEKEQRMEAHAWLRQGGLFLTGGGGHQRFTPISTFECDFPASNEPSSTTKEPT